MAQTTDTQLFGKGAAYPPGDDGDGHVQLSGGEQRVLESVQAIVETARGTCPMDPDYGLDIDAYDPIKSPDSAAWRVAQAIRRSEPRIDELEVAIVSVEPNEGTLWLEIRATPIDSSNTLIRTYPLYRVS